MHTSSPLLCALAALALTCSGAFSVAPAAPQEPVAPQESAQASQAAVRIEVEPASLTLEIGAEAQLQARLVDASGATVAGELLFFSRGRRSVSVDASGKVRALQAGKFEIVVRDRSARTNGGENQASRAGLGARLSATVAVTVRAPRLVSLELVAPAADVFVGTSVGSTTRGIDALGATRESLAPEYTTSDPTIASVDASGTLLVHRPGEFVLTAALDGVTAMRALVARANPIATLALSPAAPTAQAATRTGDVVRIAIDARDAAGAEVLGVPVELSFRGEPLDTRGAGATGQLEPVPNAEREWRFVAEEPGRYRLTGRSGAALAQLTLDVVARDVQGRFELVGHGPVRDMHTSDVWVWEGLDGRDYAVTGTWGANGDALFWDVTDPANIERIATVNVDARTVNDVKVSADGRLCVLSREGASNRKNGVVLVDVSDPRNPRVLSGFDEGLTGGVHNVFVDGNHVYALSAGQRYDVLDVSDPGTPRKVGTYKIDRPNASIHDVWVVDGLAYSSNWSDGVHVVDVGKGLAGGSPEDPKFVTSYAYPSGWNHAAFPYKPSGTGLFYVVAGDEAFPNGLNLTGKPTYPRGYLHFIDFTELQAPREVARYEVPEAGTHNLWIEDDILYCAYYNAGLRAVDVSGEVMGDLYRQGREIAWFLPDDPEGHIANAPMAWGPQPHKGHVFFSDWNSGLWAVKLVR
jgi:hypothetical protein